MDWVALATAVIELGNEILKQLPDYEQRKVENFHKLKKAWHEERIKPDGIRNDQLVMDYADELCFYVEDFTKILSKQSLASVRGT